MTEREYFMRCIEAVAGSGIREPRRLIADAKVLHEEVMQRTGEPEKGKPGRKPSGQADTAP